MPTADHLAESLGHALHLQIAALRTELGQLSAQITVLADTPGDASAARRALSSSGPWIRVDFESADRLRRRLAAPALRRAGLRAVPAGWSGAVIAGALRDADGLGPAADVLRGGGWGPALRSTLARLEDAGVTAEALRTLPAARTLDLVRALSGLLAVLARARQEEGIAAPSLVRSLALDADGPALRGIIQLGATHTDPVLARWCEGQPTRRLEAPLRPASDAADLLRLLGEVGASDRRATWYRLLRHPAMDLGAGGRTLAFWRALLVDCAEGSAGSLVVDLLAGAATDTETERAARSDLSATLRALDEDTRGLRRGGRLDEHAASGARLLRRWARDTPDRAHALDLLDELAANPGGPRLGADPAGALLHELLGSDGERRCLLSSELVGLIERACDTRLRPITVTERRRGDGSKAPHSVAELGGDPVGRRNLRLRRDAARLMAGERAVDLRPAAGFVSTGLVESAQIGDDATLAEAPGRYFMHRILGASAAASLEESPRLRPASEPREPGDHAGAIARARAGWYAGGWGEAALDHDPETASLRAADLDAWDLPG